MRELFQIGVELEVSGNVWGIAFPPSDWIPFPESGVAAVPQIPAPSEIPQPAQEEEDWSTEQVAGPQPVKSVEQVLKPSEQPLKPAEHPIEDNVRVLPLPGTGDASLQLARQMARLVAEAKQQIQATARESATQAVATETRPLLSALQAQLGDAAEKSVAAALALHLEKSQQGAQAITAP